MQNYWTQEQIPGKSTTLDPRIDGSDCGFRATRFGEEPKLPERVPLQISGDGRWVVYQDTDRTEIWDAGSGRKFLSIPKDRESAVPAFQPRILFSKDDPWIAYDDRGSIELYSSHSGKLLAKFAPTENRHKRQFAESLTLFSTAADSDLLIFGKDAVEPTAISLRDGQGRLLSELWFRRLSVSMEDAHFVAAGDANTVRKTGQGIGVQHESNSGFTHWMTAEEYDTVFSQMIARQMYPNTVEGRFHQGHRQYRSRFVKRPDNLVFISRHDWSERDINRFTEQYRKRGLHEVWRHSFVDNQGISWWSGIWTTRSQQKASKENG